MYKIVNTTMEGMVTLAIILFCSIQTVLCGWIATNGSHFCSIAHDCINTEAESFEAGKPVHDAGKPGKDDHDVCITYESYCIKESADTHSIQFYFNTDRNKFCRLILGCFKGRLITGPTVDVGQLCPNSRFCNHGPSSDAGVLKSCCVQCSCEPDCGRHNNCCYKSNDTYNIVDSEKLECLNVRIYQKSISFYMKNICSNGSKCINPYEYIVPAIGISQQQTRLIYTSDACARCNNATDIQPWNVVVFSCKKIEARISSTGCKRMVLPSTEKDKEWVLHYICSDTAKRTCHASYTNKAVIQSCNETNAIVFAANYYKTEIFANIFCVACNFFLDYTPNKKCDLFFRFKGRSPKLSMLLDLTTKMDAIKQPDQITSKDGHCTRFSVNNFGQPGCRLVFCPNDMARVNDGSCQYIARKWFDVSSILRISLLPMDGASVPVSLLRKVSSQSQLNDWMFSPCLSGEHQLHVYMLSDSISHEELVAEIVVQITHQSQEVTPKEYILGWAKCLDAPWKLILNETPYVFSPSIDENRNGPSSLEPFKTLFELIYRTDGLLHKTTGLTNIYISKLYFCEQVYLLWDEFEHDTDNDGIRILHNNLTLGTNQFDRMFNETRVCLQDYLYMDILPSRAGKTCFSAMLTSLMVVQIVFHC